MLLKLIKFLKNLHPIKNFARSIHAPRPSPTILAFSYESLTKDLEQNSEPMRLETTIPTFQNQEAFSGSMISATLDDEPELESSNVIVMSKIDFVLAQETQEEPFILQQPEKIIKLKVVEVEEDNRLEVLQSVIIDVPVIEISRTETQEEVTEVDEETTTKKTTKKRAAAKTKKDPEVKAKKVIKPIKKALPKKPMASITRSPRKKAVPPEAMGFGF